jgi:tape measure domain-containing protein
VATASSTVELIVEAARAINPLRKVERQTKRVEDQFEKARRSTKRVEAALVLMGRRGINSIRDLEANTARLGKTMGGLRGNLAKATIGFAAFKSVQEGIRRIDSERRLRLLTQRFGETAQAQEIARKAAEKFNLSQTEANVQLSRLIARLRPMGLSMQTIETAFAGFNTATILAGATASESAGAFLQLSQALGSGVLRGQELNSILEQAPLIAQAIATEMGSTVGALKKFGEEGLITSEIVIAALGRVEREGADQLKEALGGPSAQIKDFQNAVQDAQVAITESSIPAITGSIKDLGVVIRQLEPAIKFIGELLAGVARTVGNVVENVASGGKTAQARLLATRAATLQTNEKFGKPGFGNTRSPEARAFFEQTLERELSRRLAIARGAVPGQLPPSAAGVATTSAGAFQPKLKPGQGRKGRTPEEQAREAGEKRLQTLKDQARIVSGITEEERRMLELEVAIEGINRKRNLLGDELADKLIAAEKNLVVQTVLAEQLTKEEKERIAVADRLAQEMQKQKELAAEIGQTIEQGIKGAIMGAIDGSKSLSQSLSGILRQLGGMFLNRGIGSFKSADGTGGSGLLGMFANGGRPPVGRPSIVGERGPELFVPDRAGTIIPNNQLGGSTSVVVNVDASGTEVQGNQGNADQLGRLIGQAVQAELIKQKRPGGLLTR